MKRSYFQSPVVLAAAAACAALLSILSVTNRAGALMKQIDSRQERLERIRDLSAEGKQRQWARATFTESTVSKPPLADDLDRLFEGYQHEHDQQTCRDLNTGWTWCRHDIQISRIPLSNLGTILNALKAGGPGRAVTEIQIEPSPARGVARSVSLVIETLTKSRQDASR